MSSGEGKPKPHTRLVLDALGTSGLPFELRHVIRVMADLADRKTGVGRSGHARIAEALGCSVRSLARYQREIRELPGDPWVTWRRTLAKDGLGRGTDEYTVRVGSPQMPTVARKPRGQRWQLGDQPKMPNRTDLDANGARTQMPPVAEDPVSDPVLVQEGEVPPPRSEVFKTDAAGTRRVDPFAASFSQPGPIERYAFDAWTRGFEKTSSILDLKRSAILRERVETGMTQQDADDAVAGAKADAWVKGDKDGRRHDALQVIFGDAERYEEFRDRGRELRERGPSQPWKAQHAPGSFLSQYEYPPGEDPLTRAERIAFGGGNE